MKKKVAHVTFDMRIGGAEQVIANLIENTDPSKYILSIICMEQPMGPFGRNLLEKGYQIISFNRKPGFDLSLVRDIRNYIIDNNIDILHCHQYTPYVYGLFASVFTSTKIIFTEHGRFYPDKKKIKRILMNPILSLLTDCVTAISSATGNALVEYENFSRKKIRIVYNGIDDTMYTTPADTRLRQSLGIKPDDSILGTVARLDPIKNHKMMIKSLKIVHQSYPNTFLVIVGDGQEREGLESFASEMGLSSRIIFTGFKEDIHNYLKIIDVFLLTSFSEGTAMTLLEAMASSLPCIATDVGGNPEIVKDGETGFVVPNDDEKILAEKICGLLRDRDLIANMGKAGRRRFKEYFTVDKMVAAYEEIYEEITDVS
jgi:Glycosyltransferase